MTKPSAGTWSTRTAKDRQDSATRAALLDAAEEMFAEQGYQQTPVARIAERAGVSRATFYVYFSSREEVFRALAHRVRAEISAVQRAAGRRSEDPRTVIESSIRAALDVYARKTRLMAVIQHQALTDDDLADLWQEILQSPSRVDAQFIRTLTRHHGAVPAASPETVAEIVSAALLHVAALVAGEPARREQLGTELVSVYHRLVGLPSGEGASGPR